MRQHHERVLLHAQVRVAQARIEPPTVLVHQRAEAYGHITQANHHIGAHHGVLRRLEHVQQQRQMLLTKGTRDTHELAQRERRGTPHVLIGVCAGIGADVRDQRAVERQETAGTEQELPLADRRDHLANIVLGIPGHLVKLRGALPLFLGLRRIVHGLAPLELALHQLEVHELLQRHVAHDEQQLRHVERVLRTGRSPPAVGRAALAKHAHGELVEDLGAQRVRLLAEQVDGLQRVFRKAEPLAALRVAQLHGGPQPGEHGVRHRVADALVCQGALDLLGAARNALQGDAGVLGQRQVPGAELAEADAEEHVHLGRDDLAVGRGEHAEHHDGPAALCTCDGPACCVHIPEGVDHVGMHQVLALHDAEHLLQAGELGQGGVKGALDHVACDA